MAEFTEKNLPNTFGKCLGLETIDQTSIRIRTPKMTPTKEPQEEAILDYAKGHLASTGVLTMDDRNFLYVNISNGYIQDLYHLLEAPNLSPPPYLDTIYNAGAHITVALSSEIPEKDPSEFLGETISFALTGCYFVEPENWTEIETLWFLTIEAPRLSEIRTKLGLSTKIQDHEFHITFAVKKRFLSIHDLLGQSPEKNLFLKRSV